MKINEERKRYYYEKGYWTKETILDVWNRQAREHAEQEYVGDDKGLRLTYAQVDDYASRLANWMSRHDLEAGDVVGIQLPTWAEFCIVYVACLKLGCVILPISQRFNDDDLLYTLNLVKAKGFFCPAAFHETDFVDQINCVKESIPTLKTIVVVDKFKQRETELNTLAKAVESSEPIEGNPPVTSDDVAVLLLTSGTTGKSKVAMLTHNNVLFSEKSFCKGYHRTPDDVMFISAPLNHAVGFFHGLISPMLTGGRAFLMETFEPKGALEIIRREKCTWTMSATPLVYDMLKYCNQHEGENFGDMQIYSCGGAPVPSSLIECSRQRGFLLCEVYGSTESCPHVYVPPEKCLEWNGEWSGVAYEGIEIKIVDPVDGHELPVGEQGEEISRGPHQFVGYLYERDRTDRALDDDGWFYSGDLGFMDEQGRLRINGRKKEVIIRGGENISAREIDDNLLGCPGILNHATIGMPDARLGERICTFVEVEGDVTPTVKSVSDYLASKHIAKRLWPERIEIIDRIPLTPLGKVQRYKLAEELKRRMTADRTLPKQEL